MRSLITDTDTASDDAVALMMTLKHPDTQVEAVTVVAGNVPVGMGVQNALYTLEILGKNVPVYQGAETPMFGPLRTAQDVHGGDGMGDVGLPLLGREPAPEHAVDVLAEAVSRRPGELTLVTLGPLTNVAIALLRDPSFAEKVGEYVLMGGASDHHGNTTPVAEFNVWVDPEAARIVFESGMNIKMVGWDVSRKYAVMDREDSARLRDAGTPLAEFCVDIQKVVGEWAAANTELEGYDLPDPVAMAVALDPSVATKTKRRFVAVETGGRLCRGQTVVDHQEITGVAASEPNVEVVEEVSRKRFLELLHEAVRA